MFQIKTKVNKNPLIIGFLFLFLAGLFFITAVMDIRRTEHLLLDMFENKGLAIIGTIEMIAQDRFEALPQETNSISTLFKDFANIERGFQIREMILAKLIDSAKELDRSYDSDQFSKEVLKTLSKNVQAQAVIILDGNGKIVFQDAPISIELRKRLQAASKNMDDIFFDFHMEKTDQDTVHLIAVKRENKPGRIVLLFDRNDLNHLTSKIVFQEVLDERGWQKGMQYFILLDSQGRILAGAGSLTQTEIEKIISYIKAFPLGVKPSSRRVNQEAPDLLDIYAPLKIKGEKEITALVGINIKEIRLLEKRNKAHVLFSTGIIIFSAGLVLLLFYRVQALHMERIQRMREQLIQAERLSSLGKLAAGVAHEIRNPLNAVSMSVQRIFREFAPTVPEKKKQFSYLVSIVRDEISRLNRIIETFVEPARIKPTGFKPQRLTDFLDRMLRLAKETSDPMNIKIKCNVTDPDLIIFMDPARLQQAIWNFIKNAMESIQTNGTITIEAFARDTKNVVILIRDTGDGIEKKTLEKILEFEYTTKDKGLGLGLPIAKEIILAHGGKMIIESEPGKGTVIQIVLPRKNNAGVLA